MSPSFRGEMISKTHNLIFIYNHIFKPNKIPDKQPTISSNGSIQDQYSIQSRIIAED